LLHAPCAVEVVRMQSKEVEDKPHKHRMTVLY
jgi:hypothetical protein